MLSQKDVTVVYETLLSSPGMNEQVKIGLNISRRNILLLTNAMEAGLLNEPGEKNKGFLAVATQETVGELKAVCEELLRKGGLVEMNERLNALEARP